MAEAAKPETKTAVEALSTAGFMESQRHNTALFTEAHDLMLKTARALWENQSELFRLEVEHVTTIAPPKAGENPAAAIAAYCDRLHEWTDHLVVHTRKTNDLVRDYGWQLLEIYTRGFGQGVRAGQAPAPMVRNIKA